MSTKSFRELGVCNEICDVVSTLGWVKPSEIQLKAIPAALHKKDIVGLAETGSGKTAAFAIPILQDLLSKPRHNFALILTPTRELALQIKRLLMELGDKFGLKVVCLVGGQHVEDQVRDLKRLKFHVIVGTPGRVVYHLENTKELRLNHVRYFVLDEADQMLEDTFEEQLAFIVTKLHPNKQTFLYSATMTQNVEKIQKVCTQSPVILEVSPKYGKVDNLDHAFVFIPDKERDFYLIYLLLLSSKSADNSQSIIFTSTWRESFRLVAFLKNLTDLLGVDSAPLNGAMQQDKRQSSLFDFRTGRVSILVATDLASRGLDFPGVDLVINYDVPRRPSWSDSAKAYIHRVGRTARAGKHGRAVTFVTPYSVTRLKAIESALGERIPQLPWPGINCLNSQLRQQVVQADKEAREKLRVKEKQKQIRKKKKKDALNNIRAPKSKKLCQHKDPVSDEMNSDSE
ncbi:hypothetical protein MN116_006559 [Schistosoma mekongi]|uniref:RNA helicase n=1 Tax=Schistosoma mekongi TaxID=38744 RepID=A0AAE1Z821_SCHME|nr:hypothetical protein MN116_006559 [Schistosoma mekongi]